MNADGNGNGNETKITMSKQASVTPEEKGKEVVTEVEPTKEVTAQPVEARDKAKDAPSTGPELFPESVPACVAKLTAQPVEARDKAKDTPSTGPELFPESVPPCVAKLTAQPVEARDKAKGAPNTGPEFFPKSVPPCVAKLGNDASSFKAPGASNPEVMPMTTLSSATKDGRKQYADHMANIKASTKGGVLKMAPRDGKHGPELLPETVNNPPFIAKLGAKKYSGNDEDVSTCNDEYVKQQAMAEQNRRSRERKNEDLNNEGLPSSFPPRLGDNGGTKIPPPILFSDQYDEMNVEEEFLNQHDEDESQQPGAFAVSGIGAGDPSHPWQSTFEIIESRDLTENNHNTNNNQAHLSNEDMISMPHQQVSHGSENLISAIVVDDGAIPEAEAVSEEVIQRNKRRRTLCCLVGLTLIIVTIVLAAVLGRNTTSNNFSPAPSQSLVPSTLPSLSPSSSPTTTVRLFLEEVSPLSIKAFEDETSPQFRALTWLESNHTNLLNTYDKNRITQRFVLATLFYSTKGEQWIQSNGWLNAAQHECEWFSTHQNSYYRCLDFQKYVEVKLPSNRLQGTLPQEIYLLSNLRVLDFSDNVLLESLPTELGLLKNIKNINLNGNSFSGTLPTELADLKASLTHLDLSSNKIEGKIVSTMGLLTGLESLKLGDNILSGTVISEIGMLSDLQTLSLTGNNLDGTFPMRVSFWQNLEVLDLNDNLLSGMLPLTMSQTTTQALVRILPKLKELSARSNFITGSLPSDVGLMSNLKLLNVNSNYLDGSIPSELGQLVRLETLDLSGNSNVIGILPTELGLMVRLESMQISQTRISGSIGTEIGGMENLKSLDLSYNAFSGKIPETMGSLVNLESLDLRSNDLSGMILVTLGSLVNLESLDLYNNGFSGTVPETIGSLVNLEFLYLGNNDINGTIPETMGSLVNLESLDLGSNDLSGMIPKTLGSLVNLASLDLYNNGFSGTVPETIGSLVNLEYLLLGVNGLKGRIPETMGSLVNLESLDLGSNDLSGPLPETMGSLVNLDYLYIVVNDLTGEVPKGLCKLRRTNKIDHFYIDCNEISCDCCFDQCPNPPRILNSTSSTENCSDGMTLLQVATGTDQNLEGVEWDVIDKSINKTLLQGGPLTQDDRWNTILQETCVPNDACLVFTIRGSNGDGYDSIVYDNLGDRFMVHLNGSEVSNGRFEDFQEGEGFFFGETSACVATDRRQACSVTHRTCDNTGLECDLDNDGGLSGFCVASEPSVSPPLISAPVVPITSPCTLCEDGIDPPNDTLVVPGYFTSERTIEQTCGEYNEYLLNQGFLSDSDECKANQAAFGIACGCENPIASEGACRSCDGTDIPRYPYKLIIGAGDVFLGGAGDVDFTCLDGEYYAGTEGFCDFFKNNGKSFCCGQSCSNSEPCKEGYYCNFENGDDGICEFCGSPDEVSLSCSSLDTNSKGATDCTKSCIVLECDTDYSSIRVDLMTGLTPWLTLWTLKDQSSGETILQGNGYTDASITFVSHQCVKSGACFIFNIKTVGLEGPGGYNLYWNSEEVASFGGNFNEIETKLIGSCQENSFPSVSPSSSSSSMPTASPTIQTEIPTINPTAIVEDDNESLSPPCHDGMVHFTVEIIIENDPERVAWTVVNTKSGATPGDASSNDASVILQGGPYKENGVIMGVDEEGTAAITVATTFTESTCVVSDACLLLKIQDEEAVPSELSFGSVSLDSLLATVNLYADGSKVAIANFYGQSTITEVGACSPIQ